ncbi:hypothetical protein OAF85_00725 [Planctomycetota bacterium]|nr:hypothetical protein [Planctomycetota bacterium]
MKITLDLPSVAAGGAVALVLGLVAGFSPQATQVPGATNVAPRQITGQFSPHPSDFVWLEAYTAGSLNSSQSYDSPIITVPAGRILVLTGWSNNYPGGTARISIDGAERSFVGAGGAGNNSANPPTILAGGVPLVEGQTLQVRRDPNINRWTWLHGYWADA